MDFNKLTFPQALSLLPNSFDFATRAMRVQKIIDDEDYWQNGLLWAGNLPKELDLLDYLRRSFTPIPKSGEVLHRHVRALLAQEPSFGVVLAGVPEEPSGAADAPDAPLPGDVYDEVQGAWWDSQRGHEVAIDFARLLRTHGRACLRYDLPPGLLAKVETEGGVRHGVATDDWKVALSDIFMEALPPTVATVYTDPATGKKCSVFKFAEQVPNAAGAKTNVNGLQLSFLNDSGQTVLRVLKHDGTAESESTVTLETGGHLLIAEARMRPMITEGMLSINHKLNAVATMIKINADVAGFPETTLIDLNPPKEKINGEEVEVSRATPMRRQVLMSAVDTRDDEKSAAIVNVPRSGSLVYREPVSSDPLRADARWYEEQIYALAQQRHCLISGDATPSGDSRIEARADFADSLLETKPKVEGVLREVLHGSLCLAAHLARDTRVLAELQGGRVRVDVRPHAGPLSAAERAQIIAQFAAGLLSLETALVMLGIEDVGNEMENILKEQVEGFGDGAPTPAKTPDKTSGAPAAATVAE